MKPLQLSSLLLLLLALGFAACPLSWAEPESGTADAAAESEEAAARQQVLESPRWEAARSNLRQWLGVQNAYSDEQVQALDSELRNRIATLSADELEIFLQEMEAKLAVLLDPATIDARQWVDKYYTDSAKQRMAKKYGVEDPLRLSAAEVAEAVNSFYQDRQAKLSEKAVIDRARTNQNKAGSTLRASQQQARGSQQVRSRPANSSATYAPRRKKPQVYRAPYPKGSYTVGPWGGVYRHF